MSTKLSKPITEQTALKITALVCGTVLLIAALIPLFQSEFWGKMGFFYVIMIGITIYSLFRNR